MRINREEFLTRLELLQPGLSAQEVIDQSSCFAFQDGRVMTYNEEVACRAKSPIELEGVVAAAPLLNLLRKMVEDEIEIEQTDGELQISGKRGRGGIRMESEISLPIDQVEKPGEWQELPQNFGEAVALVEQSAGRDDSNFAMTCIHMTPRFIEACDNIQLTQYRLKTGLRENVLVRRDSVRHISNLGCTKFSETDTWLHFRGPGGLVFSVRRFVEDYHDTTALLAVEGETITLPRGLDEAAARAADFARENAEFDYVIIKIRPDKIICRGEGSQGWWSEPRKIKYAGRPITFTISPAILSEIVKKHSDCVISEKRLKVEGENWTFVTYLGMPDKKAE